MSFGAIPSGPIEQRLEKITASLKAIEPLLADQKKFNNECETVFGKQLRIPIIHLRKDKEALDAVPNKDVFWKFICKMCKERPFLKERCGEVLDILMLSEEWKKALATEPEADRNALPDKYKGESTAPVGVTVCVQPCSAAKMLIGQKATAGKGDGKGGGYGAAAKGLAAVAGEEWVETGVGLHIAVSFNTDAAADRFEMAARSLLTAKLLSGESVVDHCGKHQIVGVFVSPQPCLRSRLSLSDGVVSLDGPDPDAFGKLYDKFVEALRTVASSDLVSADARPNIRASTFGGRQAFELSSGGDMHSFTI